MSESRIRKVWACDEERGNGSSKSGYENECLRKKIKKGEVELYLFCSICTWVKKK